MSEYAGNLVTSLRAGARLAPNEAARAALPLVQTLVGEHVRGLVRGTIDPEYVAPEVSEGRPATTATDVWSVGALLFHAMSGHAPYEHSPEQPARLRRAGWLGPLVEMALATDPAERPDMAEVAAYLQARQADDEPEPTLPEALVESADVAMDGADRDRRTAMLVVVLAALVLTLGVVATILVLGRHGVRHTPVAGTPSPVLPSVSTHHHHHHHAAPEPPPARQLTEFARSYVATASSDPGAGFRMLTPAYQHLSPRYRQFWSSVRDARISSVSADPRWMTVTYTYRYRLRTVRTETVTLHLVRRHGHLMIAGAG